MTTHQRFGALKMYQKTLALLLLCVLLPIILIHVATDQDWTPKGGWYGSMSSESRLNQEIGIYGTGPRNAGLYSLESPSRQTRYGAARALEETYTEYRLRSDMSSRSKLKVIRYMRGWQNNPSVVKGEIATDFASKSMDLCGYRCVVEPGFMDTTGADIAVFIGTTLEAMEHRKPRKKPDELWVFHSAEPQYRSAAKPENWDGLFNYSTAFVPWPDGHISIKASSFTKRPEQGSHNFARKRRDWLIKHNISVNSVDALWFVSHCVHGLRPSSARAEYALELGKYINISAYSYKDECRTVLSAIMRNETEGRKPKLNDYLFYLAFENSVCKDYITEKLWKILMTDTFTIPVVLGGQSIEDYTRVAPPNSFIHVRNFTSPRHLAEHLEYVASNDEAYNYYHQWRNDYILNKRNQDTSLLCHYCMLAHERPPQVWETFSKDFTADKDCADLTKQENHCVYYNMTCNQT